MGEGSFLDEEFGGILFFLDFLFLLLLDLVIFLFFSLDFLLGLVVWGCGGVEVCGLLFFKVYLRFLLFLGFLLVSIFLGEVVSGDDWFCLVL